MFQDLKRVLYFPLAWYFRFFAKIKLAKWKPKIIVVTGSNGKTTTMAFIESQLGNKAFYSHHANSAYGIPFNILGLSRKTLLPSEWINLFLLTPFKTFSKIPEQKLYVVEADCDRPGEGKFLSDLLTPEVTIWLSSSRTHSMNFDSLVLAGKFQNVEEAIANEYGYFLEKTSKLVITNADSKLIKKQVSQTQSQKIGISNQSLQEYIVSKEGSVFKIDNKVYKFKYLLPHAAFLSIAATIKLTEYLGENVDQSFRNFKLPPGRSSVFMGIKNIIIVDSSYNSNFSSASEIINMFNLISADVKWAVIGDMLEQGIEEKEEHEKLAELIMQSNYNRVLLLGPRITKHGLPKLKVRYGSKVFSTESPKEILDYLQANIKGGEVVLFKGARFMEGVIEHLLADKEDITKLSRREKIWDLRRKKWDL